MNRAYLLWGLALLLGPMLLSAAGPSFPNLSGGVQNPFQSKVKARILLFVRADCPITNRYAPELQRIAAEFNNESVQFWLIYPDRDESASNVQSQLNQFHLPGTPLMDPHHQLVERARATVAPEAAVFDGAGKLVYHGRIDDRWLGPGKSKPAATVHDLEDAITATLHGDSVRDPHTKAVGCALADIE